MSTLLNYFFRCIIFLYLTLSNRISDSFTERVYFVLMDDAEKMKLHDWKI